MLTVICSCKNNTIIYFIKKNKTFVNSRSTSKHTIRLSNSKPARTRAHQRLSSTRTKDERSPARELWLESFSMLPHDITLHWTECACASSRVKKGLHWMVLNITKPTQLTLTHEMCTPITSSLISLSLFQVGSPTFRSFIHSRAVHSLFNFSLLHGRLQSLESLREYSTFVFSRIVDIAVFSLRCRAFLKNKKECLTCFAISIRYLAVLISRWLSYIHSKDS